MSDLPKQLNEWIEITYREVSDINGFSAIERMRYHQGMLKTAHKLLADANKLVEALEFTLKSINEMNDYSGHCYGCDCKHDLIEDIKLGPVFDSSDPVKQTLAEWKEKYHE